MSDSKLVVYTKLSPNRTAPRKDAIDTITIHMVVGQVTAERLGDIFAPVAKQASSNYGVDKDGRVGQYCLEANRSWCTGTGNAKGTNDHRAVTIEVASDTRPPYAVTDKAYNALIDLCVDVCKRNGKNKLVFLGNRASTESAWTKNDPEAMYLTAHKWFNNTSCPGEYLYSRFGQISQQVTSRLNPEPEPSVPTVILASDSPIYASAANAINHVNSVGTYKAGEYFVFRYYSYKSKNDTVNITKQAGQAGGWIAVEDLDDVFYTTKSGDTVASVRALNPVDLVDNLRIEPGQKIKIK